MTDIGLDGSPRNAVGEYAKFCVASSQGVSFVWTIDAKNAYYY